MNSLEAGSLEFPPPDLWQVDLWQVDLWQTGIHGERTQAPA
jgi:hypothetical protein